ncbi:hypothetical protein BKA67DRAFT_660094 [Truncatella angustata]|uniref:VWFA domain-containing protein n=1 Tax=Truncatella angustata TaxID=152316 RepID=A0A9P8UJX9_9PEZI|nr:uncharacterized protein BKA67DRAFT_660094 [Truncatella angustata]KAH6653481.1 hypothetical protein BKA67DRAFT_660094 [Truncatella angustata]
MSPSWPFARRLHQLSRVLSLNDKASSNSDNPTKRSTNASAVRSPRQDLSPATQEPRAQSPPPAYITVVTDTSVPSLGVSPRHDCYQTGIHPAISRAQASTKEDEYAFLSTFDTVFLIDDSSSMTGRSWRETQQALTAILPVIFSHDKDGLDFYFMNHKTTDSGNPNEPWKANTGYRNVKRAEGSSFRGEQMTVEEIFDKVRPYGATPTGQRLQHILRQYTKTYEAMVNNTKDETCLKPLSIIVITDGVPSDEVGGVIQQVATKLDKLDAPSYQIGIQFFQVGNEPGAAEALRILDDKLTQDKNCGNSNQGRGGEVPIRDIVDTATFDDDSSNPFLTGERILKIVLGSVVRRLDDIDSNLRGTPNRSAF